MTPWLVTDPAEALVQNKTLGGKAKALAEAMRHGLPVPQWVVLQPEWIESRIDTIDFVAYSPEEQRRQLTNPTLLAELQADVADVLVTRFKGTPFLAVRSSARDEDGAHHSFAGMLESFLFVPHDDVAAKIVEVWLSGWSQRLSVYRKKQGLDARGCFPAVLIQAMVPAEKSGVAFGLDPVSGHAGLRMISAVWGLGSGLVSGECESDTLYVNPKNEIVHYTIAEKTQAHRQGMGTVITTPVPDAQQKQPVLSAPETLQIATLVQQAGEAFGTPQDIEWAMAEGKLYLLQSRPITTPADSFASSDNHWHTWDNTATVESWPGVSTPLTYAVAQKLLISIYRDTALLTGFPKVPPTELEPLLTSLTGQRNGQIYLDQAQLENVWHQSPAITYRMAECLQSWRDLKNRVNKTLSGIPTPPLLWADMTHVVRLGQISAQGFFRLIRLYCSLPKHYRQFHRQLAPYLKSPSSPESCWPEIQALLNLLENHWQAPNLNTYFLQRLMAMLHVLDPSDSWLMQAESHPRQLSHQFQNQLNLLAAQIKASPALQSKLATQDFEDFPAFESAFKTLLNTFGDRCAMDLKMESTPWRDDPTPLIQTLLSLADTSTSHSDRSKSPSPLAKGLLFKIVYRAYQARLNDREALRLGCSRAFAALRQRFLSLGNYYCTQGILSEATDILYLDLIDIERLTQGSLTQSCLQERIKKRRGDTQRFLELPPLPDQFTSWGPLLPMLLPDDPTPLDSPQMQGQGCSPGRANGDVIWLTDELSIPECQGKILAAPYGDPGLVRFYPVISGLLLERGSALSHAAIVARELGIPTITSLRGLASWVKNNEDITMDGSTGHVRKNG